MSVYGKELGQIDRKIEFFVENFGKVKDQQMHVHFNCINPMLLIEPNAVDFGRVIFQTKEKY